MNISELILILLISSSILFLIYINFSRDIIKNQGTVDLKESDHKVIEKLENKEINEPEMSFKKNCVLPYPKLTSESQMSSILPSDLLPKEDSENLWKDSVPNVPGSLSDKNFLKTAHHFGVDTISNTMKNANLQIRSDPLIVPQQVGPWSQSTYGIDTNRRQLEIGSS